MTNVHHLFALLLALGALLVLGVVGTAAIRRQPARFAVDRAILAAEAVVLAGAATGLVVLLTGGHPADPLHLLYAVVAMLVLPAVRFWHRLASHRRLALGIAAVVLAGLALRLFQTG